MDKRSPQTTITDLEKSNEKLTSEVKQLSNMMDNAHKARDQLLGRNKQLEADMKALKREFSKRVTEAVNEQLKNKNKSMSSVSKTSPCPP